MSILSDVARSSVAASVLGAILLSCGAVRAQTAPDADNTAAENSDLWTRSNLLGDMGGLRPFLGQVGLTFSLQETSEVFGNTSGGVSRGVAYEGLTQMGLTLDTAKAFGWSGGEFNASALQIHGRNLSAERLDNLQTISGIEASRATRLWELWYQQEFPGDAVDVRLGQQSLDQEFMVSQYSALFVNTMMGWPMVPSADLYAGGPAYPLSSLGARLRVKPSKPVTILAGVFDDNPPGGPFSDDPQLRGAEAAGLKFNTNTGALMIAELQYAVGQTASSSAESSAPDSGLPGTYKLGAWFDTARFPDQRLDNTGLSLANPASSGVPAMRRGNWSIYAVADQTVWRDSDGSRSISVFARPMGAAGDRNLIDFSINTGVSVAAPLPGRQNDTFDIGYGLAKVSGSASALDRDMVLFGGTARPVRSAESFIEVTYQFQATPWWLIQPDFQYIINPGGGIPDPNRPGTRIQDEAVFGLRTNIVF